MSSFGREASFSHRLLCLLPCSMEFMSATLFLLALPSFAHWSHSLEPAARSRSRSRSRFTRSTIAVDRRCLQFYNFIPRSNLAWLLRSLFHRVLPPESCCSCGLQLGQGRRPTPTPIPTSVPN
ncbi:hypothetical protein BT96DRAFT_305151 [Gymnopus androsaceus JB14]|uniref:Uncharacterized protein n=1 Tax=Gymnopus androsaceus JB14 TaxID=1447944 RepID=A0A6A4I8Y5_9AGAR|nr:hypothetical protein BT96DRAFT_305151 [Gymnopus androsaceus JB14]